jgi:hypothetical protein
VKRFHSTFHLLKNKKEMAQHVKETLSNFARHTQQSEKQAENASLIAQKYLALHSKLAPVGVIYPYIASDYLLMCLKTHSPPLNAYSDEHTMVDIPTFCHLMQTGYPKGPVQASPNSALAHFQDNVMPKPVGEEQWVNYERDNHWKDRAYFLSLNYKNHAAFHDLVQTIAGNTAEGDAMYQKLLNYTLPASISAKEIASLIKELKISNVEVDPQGTAPIPTRTVAKPHETHGDLPTKSPIVFVANKQSEEAPRLWSDIGQDEHVQDYRRRANLSASYSPKKLVKQMILSSIGVPATSAESLVPKNVPLSDATFPAVSAEAWPVLMNAVESMDAEKHALNPASPALCEILPGGPADAVSTIQTMLTLYHPSCELKTMDEGTKMQFMKSYPQIDESIIKSIIGM